MECGKSSCPDLLCVTFTYEFEGKEPRKEKKIDVDVRRGFVFCASQKLS